MSNCVQILSCPPHTLHHTHTPHTHTHLTPHTPHTHTSHTHLTHTHTHTSHTHTPHTHLTHTPHTHSTSHTHPPPPPPPSQYCFEICLTEKLRRGTLIKACKTNADGKVVVGHHLHYRIQASSEQEMGEWMKRIRASISRNPFLEMLQQRRQRVSKKGPVGL